MAKKYKSIKVPVYTNTRTRVIRNESMAIQEQINSIQKQIHELVLKKKALRRQLKARGEKPVKSSYLEKTIVLYVLELENGCWYVGQTRNLDKRYKTHEKGKGAIWTRANKPIAVYYEKNTGLTDTSEVALMEDELTLEYARKYGTDKVRGGGYCQTKPRWPKEAYEPDISWA